MSSVMALGRHYPAPPGLRILGQADGEPQFRHYPWAEKVTNIVLHESVTMSKPTAVAVLQNRGFGVHLIIAPNGLVTQHGDLRLDKLIHGEQLNNVSVGIEIINPYSPLYARPPFTQTIPAEWWTWVPTGAPRAYTVPTSQQVAALKLLVPWLCGTVLPDCPFEFPTGGLTLDKMKHPGPGVVAHGDFGSHADGRYPLEVLMGVRS